MHVRDIREIMQNNNYYLFHQKENRNKISCFFKSSINYLFYQMLKILNCENQKFNQVENFTLLFLISVYLLILKIIISSNSYFDFRHICDNQRSLHNVAVSSEHHRETHTHTHLHTNSLLYHRWRFKPYQSIIFGLDRS